MFLNMRPYEDRKVARYEEDALAVSTVMVEDGSKPFETAVKHPDYDKNWIVVEAYDTRELAQAGHDKWVVAMTTGELPDALVDCANCMAASVINPEDLTFVRKTL